MEYKVKGKRVLSIEALPVYIGNVETLSEDKIVEYLTRMLHAENAGKNVTDIKLKYKCIRMNTKIKLDGHYYYIAGKTNLQICIENAVELFLSTNLEKYVKKIDKAKTSGNYGEKDSNDCLIITQEKNKELYKSLLENIQSNVYCNRKSSIVHILDTGKDVFSNLDVEKQCEVLLQIIRWMGNVFAGIDLSLIGGSSKTGTCRMGKKVTNAKELELIFNSTTGVFEKTLDLLEL